MDSVMLSPRCAWITASLLGGWSPVAHAMLKLLPNPSGPHKLDQPTLRTKNSHKKQPKRCVVCVEDVIKLFVRESILRCLFEHAHAVLVSCLFKRYVWPIMRYPKQCTGLSD